MNSATTYHDMMADYLDGTLRGSDLLAFDRLLQEDAEFQRAYAGYCKTVAAVKQIPHAKLSEFGRARLRRTMKQQRRQLQAPNYFRPLSYAAAAVFLMSIGFVSGRQFQQEEAAIVQALPSPAPAVRLRDAQTGSWLNAAEFAARVERSRQNYAVVPQVRGESATTKARVEQVQREVREALDNRSVNGQLVQFFAPVAVQDNLLEGPELEFWVQPVSLQAPTTR